MKSRKSHKEWELLVNQYKDSKLSIVKFSQENNLKASTLAYWVKKIRSVEGIPGTNLVRIKKTINSELKIKISYGEIFMEIPSYTSTEIIISLINSIKAASTYVI